MAHEDVAGIVIEPGSRNTRIGISGDLKPTYVATTALLRGGTKTEYEIPLIGSPLPDDEVITPVVDGVVQDYEAATGLWGHFVDEKLGMRFDEQPLTITEEVWAPNASREKMFETVFETLGVPLFQLVKAPLAATFESTRSSALVVSVGAAVASVVPVVDGLVRSKAATHSRFAGDFVDAHVLMQLEHAQPNLVPEYQVSAKQLGLAEGQVPSLTGPYKLRPRGSDSYHMFQMSRLIDEFKRVVCAVSPVALKGPEMTGTRVFEFPTGFNLTVDHERMVAVEPLFQPTMSALPDGSQPGVNSLGLSELIYQTVQKVDAPSEVMLSLLSNIVLHGGTTKLPGVVDRLTNDLLVTMPNQRPRIHHALGNPAWTGASILASLNEYDESLWSTKQQYEEMGAQHLLEKQE